MREPVSKNKIPIEEDFQYQPTASTDAQGHIHDYYHVLVQEHAHIHTHLFWILGYSICSLYTSIESLPHHTPHQILLFLYIQHFLFH